MLCPSCSRDAGDGSLECPFCGVVFRKWQQAGRRTTGRGTQATPAAADAGRHSASRPFRRLLGVALTGVAGAALLVGGYWYFEIRPRMAGSAKGIAPSSTKTLRVSNRSIGDFDLHVGLPIRPFGLASDGRTFLATTPGEPAGVVRLEQKGTKKFSVQHVPITEPAYNQRITVDAVTWNGTNWIGYVDGAWFQSNGEHFFTVHHPTTLRVTDRKPAPALLGCIAWDGAGYWAATRRNTVDSVEPAFLYRLDASFQVTSRLDLPSVGCQGMAWDGEHLWLADVFSDSMFVLDVSGDSPQVVHEASLPFSYPAGVAFDASGDLWIAEYDDNAIHRLKREVRLSWSGATEPKAVVASVVPPVARPAEAGADIDDLRRKLRSDHWGDRMQAEMQLKRLGIPIDYDREQDSFAKRDPEEADVLDWWAEIRGDHLVASWTAWFGDVFFDNGPSAGGIVSIPTFVRYTVSVEGGTLPRKIEHEFDAEPGENVRSDVDLVNGLGPGKYTVSFFIHIQYITAASENRIINRSAMSLFVEK